MAEVKKKLAQGLSTSLASTSAASAASVANIQPLAAAAMGIATDGFKKAAEQLAQHASNHPYVTAAMVTGAVITLVPGVIAAPALHLAGFGAEGVVANSAAAAAHSGIGNAVAGSVFSTLQSAGAGGAGIAVVNGVVQGAGVGAAAVATGGRFLWARVGGLKAKL